MTGVVDTVARTVRRNHLIRSGDRVAVAVSGGADSVAMTWILRTLAADLGASVAVLIHVNHGLRGAASDADEAFCRALAGRLGFAVVNDTNKTMNIKYGVGASATAMIGQVGPGGTWTDPFHWVGIVHAWWPAGVAGSARITELSP